MKPTLPSEAQPQIATDAVTPKSTEISWMALLDSAIDTLLEKENDWSALPEPVQELAALWKLEMDINNGGFMQFFCNWGVEVYRHAIRGLERVGAYQLQAIVQQQYELINSVYGRCRDQIESYWDLPPHFSEAELESLDQLDQAYWQYPDNLEALGLACYAGLSLDC